MTEMTKKPIDFDIPPVLPVLPLRNTVVFPNQVQPLAVGRPRSLEMLNQLEEPKVLVLVTQRDGNQENPDPDALYEVGVIATVVKSFKMPDNSEHAIIQGIHRCRIKAFIQEEPYFLAEVDVLMEDDTEDTVHNQALVKSTKSLYEKIVEIAPNMNEEHLMVVDNQSDPGQVADAITANLNVDTDRKQSMLEIIDPMDRLKQVHYDLSREIQVLEIESKIQRDVQGELHKTQREYVLKEQMKAIRKELGELDEHDEIEELKQLIEDAKMPKDVKKVADKEINRLSQMNQMSAEYGVIRNYLDWLIDVPWSKKSRDRLDLKLAKKVLDEDHYGLDQVKDRIIEFLAVKKLKSSVKGPILCLVGPPGVGKTSLGKSVARALNRKFGRISLGGVSDEAEIRGHRRTYIGAMPGRIIRELKKLNVNNPVIMLDEIDKLGRDYKGDPSAALLEVLDPEQNHAFLDHYLDVDMDLSHVLFVATANQTDTIPLPLLDRMEVIQISGYIEDEKMRIAQKYLVPKQLERHGIGDHKVKLNPAALRHIIHSYTREAGVRGLEKQIASVARGVATRYVKEKQIDRSITKKGVEQILGAPKYEYDVKERVSKPGVATGMAWTPVGGDILFIEATTMPGKNRLKLTGQLGDIMKESAETAISLLRSRATELGLSDDVFSDRDVHIHVPAGATPKDGPSAGITLFTALFSIFSGFPVKPNVAMTGEITLRGLVLPIGGLKEKILAAKRAGIDTIIAPGKNQKQLEEIPKRHLKGLSFYFVEDIRDVVKLAIDFSNQEVPFQSVSSYRQIEYHH